MTLPFPTFVLVRNVDSSFFNAANLPEKTPVVSVHVPIKGELRSCLAWFTNEQAAESFIRTSSKKSSTIRIDDVFTATDFLRNHRFYAICVDPTGIGDFPTTIDFESFLSGHEDECNAS